MLSVALTRCFHFLLAILMRQRKWRGPWGPGEHIWCGESVSYVAVLAEPLQARCRPTSPRRQEVDCVPFCSEAGIWALPSWVWPQVSGHNSSLCSPLPLDSGFEKNVSEGVAPGTDSNATLLFYDCNNHGSLYGALPRFQALFWMVCTCWSCKAPKSLKRLLMQRESHGVTQPDPLVHPRHVPTGAAKTGSVSCDYRSFSFPLYFFWFLLYVSLFFCC